MCLELNKQNYLVLLRQGNEVWYTPNISDTWITTQAYSLRAETYQIVQEWTKHTCKQ